MALKYILDSLDGLPEDVKKEYVEVDGKFKLNVDGAVPNEEIASLRSALQKERERATANEKAAKAWGDLKPEDYHKIRDELDELKLSGGSGGAFDISKLTEDQKKALLGKEFDERVNVRMRAAERDKADLQKQLKELAEARAALESEYTGEKLRASVSALVAKNERLIPSAMEDILLRAKSLLKYNPDVKDFTDESGTPLKEALDNWIANSQHWLKGSQGAGAEGGKGGSGGAAPKTAAEVAESEWK